MLHVGRSRYVGRFVVVIVTTLAVALIVVYVVVVLVSIDVNDGWVNGCSSPSHRRSLVDLCA